MFTISNTTIKINVNLPDLGSFYTDNELAYYLHDKVDIVSASMSHGDYAYVEFDLDEYNKEEIDQAVSEMKKAAGVWCDLIIKEIKEKIARLEEDAEDIGEENEFYQSYFDEIDELNRTIEKVESYKKELI